ncbi:MAG: metal ABC transporter substrate-binding protein, partial [Cyanobacteria bacterium P01_A01_bin.40]
EHGHEEHGHEESEAELELSADPHVWHSVENTVAMVEQLKSLLTQLNPQSAELYLNNTSAYIEQLWQLDAWIKEMIETIPQGQGILVTTHSSLNYFVQAYNLEGYQTLQGISSDDSPSAAQVRDLVAQIKQAKVPTIFAESTKSDRVINNVAREANVELSESKLYADGLGNATDYIDMMSHNTCAIVNGLGGKCQPFATRN